MIPTRSIVQTLAAVAVHDPSIRFDDDVIAMTRAAGATRYAAVTVASSAALTTVGPCEVGDILGLAELKADPKELEVIQIFKERAAAADAKLGQHDFRWPSRMDQLSAPSCGSGGGASAPASAPVAARVAALQRSVATARALSRAAVDARLVAGALEPGLRRRGLARAGGGAGRAMFLLAQTDPLRVYINVPQSSAQLVKRGQKAKIGRAHV